MKTTCMFILSLLLSSCSPDFFDQAVPNAKLDAKEPDIVIEGYCGKDSVFSVLLSKSKPTFNASATEYTLDNATVTISNKGTACILNLDNPAFNGNKFNQSRYRAADTAFKFKTGETYDITVHANNKTATATCVIPGDAPVFTYKVDSLQGNEDDDVYIDYYAIIEWDVAAGDQNYYVLQAESRSTGNTNWSKSYTSYDEEYAYASHDAANGHFKKSIALMRKYKKYYYPNSYPYEFRLSLVRANKDFYNFYKTYKLNAYGGEDPFAEPVSLFNNVKGGYGIFSGYAVRQTTFVSNIY